MGKPKKVENLIKIRNRKILVRRFWFVMRVVLMICFLAAAVWGLNYFYNSSYFKIKSLNIEGNTHYDEDSLGKFTRDIPGTNIFEINKKAVEDSLKSGLVWVRSVELRKIFPDSIVIIIQERNPALIASYKNDYYLLDDDGLILENIGLEEIKSYGDLVLVRDAFDHKLDPGEAIAAKNILSTGSIYNVMDEETRTLIKEAGIEENIAGDIYFTTYNNEKIIFGDSNEIIKKIEVLKLLLKQETKYNIIDLRNPENPVVKE
ncbi:cell division protein FtsQ/DivIB [Actinomycetota bacterium]